MRRGRGSSIGTASSRPKVLAIVAGLFLLTYFNYRWALQGGVDPAELTTIVRAASIKASSKPTAGIRVETDNADGTERPPMVSAKLSDLLDTQIDPPDPAVFNITYEGALALFESNLKVEVEEDVKQPTKAFFDVPENPDHGVLLPHDASQISPEEQWRACDARNAEFTPERDALCQKYLSNVNNMRSIKTLSAILKKGRTIKYKIFYHHNGIEAIVKVSQMKFVFEPVSEYLAYALDRELNFSRTPTSAYVALPLEYMKAASAVVSPFYSQWFKYFVLDYEFTSHYFVPCTEGSHEKHCSLVTIQLWMKDVHSALMSNLAVPYEYDEHFAEKFYNPSYKKWPPKPLRLRAIGDINVRFIFDFLMGNTDRGLNDHNNFVYGGCDETTRCTPREPSERTKGIHKYAFIDHGSSFYSRKEPEENPFTGNMSDIWICRYRRSTYDTFKRFQAVPGAEEKYPLVVQVKSKLPKNLFRIVSFSVFQQVQTRMEKVIKVMETCVERYGEAGVFSLPEYWQV